MATSVRTSGFGDFGSFAPSKKPPSTDPSVPRRPALQTALSANSGAKLAGIWGNDPRGGLSALQREPSVTSHIPAPGIYGDPSLPDNGAPIRRQGPGSLLPNSELDGWPRRNSQWSTATAPTIRPIDAGGVTAAANARRASAFPALRPTEPAFIEAPQTARRPGLNASFSHKSSYDETCMHMSSYSDRVQEADREPTGSSQKLLHGAQRTNSWPLEPPSFDDGRLWHTDGTSSHQMSSRDGTRPGSRASTAESNNMSSHRWNGQFDAASHPPAAPARGSINSHTVRPLDQSADRQELQLAIDMNRMHIDNYARQPLQQYHQHQQGDEMYISQRSQSKRLESSSDFIPDWSQHLLTTAGRAPPGTHVDQSRHVDESRPHTGYFRDPRYIDHTSEVKKHSQLSAAGSPSFSPSERPGTAELQHLHRSQLYPYARLDQAPPLDGIYTEVRSHGDDSRLHAMWSARMYPPYSTNSYMFPQTGMGTYGLPAHTGSGSWAVPRTTPPISDYQDGHGIASNLMLDFHRSNAKGGRRYELRDIFDHAVEFAGDQHGSRFIQQKLETANSDEKNRIFIELQPNAIQLMKDVFGNYVIQKFFEHGDQSQKRTLANYMQGQVLDLSLNVYGCRVVQKALEHVLVDQQVSMTTELRDHVLRCVKDQNGNHVIQMAIQKVPAKHIDFVINAFIGQVQNLATHTFGCRVVQRLLEHCEEPARSLLLRELHGCAMALICDQYGNYVTQHVIQHGNPEDRRRLIDLVKEHLIPFSKQKFASNVVEKSMVNGTDEDRHSIMMQFAARDDRGETALPFLLKDGYGNYVIQRLLDTLSDADYYHFLTILEPELDKARRTGPNKQVENVAKKMCRLPQTTTDGGGTCAT